MRATLEQRLRLPPCELKVTGLNMETASLHAGVRLRTSDPPPYPILVGGTELPFFLFLYYYYEMWFLTEAHCLSEYLATAHVLHQTELDLYLKNLSYLVRSPKFYFSLRPHILLTTKWVASFI